MDELHNLPELITYQFLNKKVIQLLLSLSFLSLLFFSSPWYSFYLHYFNVYLSELPFQFLSHSMDRNYVFLICNGILVLLAKTSGFNIPSPSVDSDHLNDQLVVNRIGDSLQSSSEATKDSLMIEKEEALVETSTGMTDLETDLVMEKDEERADDQYLMEGESENYSNFVLEGEEEEVETVNMNTKGGDEEKQESGTCFAEEDEDIERGFIIEEEEEEEEEEDGNDELLKTEELNKKFDDFIRRVKQEIRIQAQHQLVINV